MPVNQFVKLTPNMKTNFGLLGPILIFTHTKYDYIIENYWQKQDQCCEIHPILDALIAQKGKKLFLCPQPQYTIQVRQSLPCLFADGFQSVNV
jgi:hypothetical protein